jgi:hypothetical protein
MVASTTMLTGSFQRSRRRIVISSALLLAAVSGTSCYDFHLTGPEDPPSVPATQLVKVSIEYRQQAGCNNDPGKCDDPVVFFASWARAGTEFALQRDATSFIWRGTALGVPVNYPPSGQSAYQVRVYDPHFARGTTGGFTGNNIRIGRQVLTSLTSAGTTREAAEVYIDPDGEGHNPF